MSEFPRPCKNCGNPVHLNAKGVIVHVRRNAINCRFFREYELVRDAAGKVCKMLWVGDHPIPDPTTENRAEIDKKRLEEWNALYGAKA